MTYKCAKCGKELNKVLECRSKASKAWLRKYKYDGAEWVKPYKQIKCLFEFPYLPKPFWPNFVRTVQHVKFSLCLDCTPEQFFIGKVDDDT